VSKKIFYGSRIFFWVTCSKSTLKMTARVLYKNRNVRKSCMTYNIIHGKKTEPNLLQQTDRILRHIKRESLYALYFNIIYKKSLPPEKPSRLNIYVSGTDGIVYTVLVLRVGSGKMHGQGTVWDMRRANC